MSTNTPAARLGGAAPEGAESRRKVSRQVNVEIRKIAATFALSPGVTDEPYVFICECGCMAFVELSLALYDMEGAWLHGHKPQEPSRLHLTQ